MASKKENIATEQVEVEEPKVQEETNLEEEKLDIEDIKDPAEKPEEVDLEEVVEEKEEAPVIIEAKTAEPKKEKKSWFSKKGKPKKEKSLKQKTEKIPAPAEEPIFVPKKKGLVGKIMTIVVTVIITAALVLGGVYAYLKYFQPAKDNTENNQPIAVTEEKEDSKYVYVDSSAGLNLRKEPSTLSEILIIIPNGTKLKVLEENEGWYKVEYEEKEGWVSKEFVTEKNPLAYENSTYGFTFEIPADWTGYKVIEKKSETGVKGFIVVIPTTDTNWTDIEGVPVGFASKFVLTVFTPEQYQKVKAESEISPVKQAENSKYVFAADSAQAAPTDHVSKTGPGPVINTIKAL